MNFNWYTVEPGRALAKNVPDTWIQRADIVTETSSNLRNLPLIYRGVGGGGKGICDPVAGWQVPFTVNNYWLHGQHHVNNKIRVGIVVSDIQEYCRLLELTWMLNVYFIINVNFLKIGILYILLIIYF